MKKVIYRWWGVNKRQINRGGWKNRCWRNWTTFLLKPWADHTSALVSMRNAMMGRKVVFYCPKMASHGWERQHYVSIYVQPLRGRLIRCRIASNLIESLPLTPVGKPNQKWRCGDVDSASAYNKIQNDKGTRMSIPHISLDPMPTADTFPNQKVKLGIGSPSVAGIFDHDMQALFFAFFYDAESDLIKALEAKIFGFH